MAKHTYAKMLVDAGYKVVVVERQRQTKEAQKEHNIDKQNTYDERQESKVVVVEQVERVAEQQQRKDYTIPYYTILHYGTLCYTILYYTTLYYTVI